MIDKLSKIKIKTYSLVPTHRIFSYNYKILPDFIYAGAFLEDGTIILNDKYLKKDNKIIDEKDLICILAHEVLHDLFQHIQRCKFLLGKNCSKKDEVLWNLACDEIVNRIIIEIGEQKGIDVSFLKEEGINLSKIYGEKIKEFPVEILYRFLKENTEILDFEIEKIEINGKELTVVSCEIVDKDTYDKIYEYPNLILAERDEDGNIKNKKETTGSYIYEIDENLKKAGIGSATLEIEVEMVKNPLGLKPYLQNYLNVIKSGLDDISFLKPGKLNLIFPESKLLYPTYVSRKCNVVIGVDVSGSISDKEFSNFISIIYENRKFFNGKIYFCDTEIKKEIDLLDETEQGLTDIYKKLQKRIGYGGTLFDPVFEKAKELNVDLLIYFTDLYPAEWPDLPNFKVLWVVYANIDTYKIKVPFGKVIYF